MWELEIRMQGHIVAPIEEIVETLQRWEAIRLHVFRPVVGGCHPERPRRPYGGNLDVVGADPKVARVFAGAASLHMGTDHDRREDRRRTIVERTEDARRRAAAALAGHSDALRI